jgi:hypothetical protein
VHRIFDPGPKTYKRLLDRLDRQIGLKYKDYSTALDFTLKATPSKSEGNEQEVLFVAANIVEAPQKEDLFSPKALS